MLYINLRCTMEDVSIPILVISKLTLHLLDKLNRDLNTLLSI